MDQKTESHKIFCKSFTTIDEWQMGSSSSLSRSPSSRSARSTEWAWTGSRMITNAMQLSAVTAYTTYTSTAVTVYTACTVADMPTYMFRALRWYGLWALGQNVGLEGLTGWYPFDGYDYKSTCDAKKSETMKTVSLNTVAIKKRRRTRSEDLALSTSLLSIPYYSDIFWSDVYYWNLDICKKDVWS